jgi:dihydropteroate synthase
MLEPIPANQMQNLYRNKKKFRRIVPVVNLIPKTFSETIISIDTFRSEVAKASIESGAAIINDISAGNLDEKMFEI